jgi:hypothetical protein
LHCLSGLPRRIIRTGWPLFFSDRTILADIDKPKIFLDWSLHTLYYEETFLNPSNRAVVLMRYTFELKGFGVLCGRSAMLVLIACTLLGASSRASQITDDSTERVHSVITGRTGTLMIWPDSSRPCRGATLSQFTPWKTRLKSVLEETKQRIVEECDLGPALISGHIFTSGTVELLSCPLPTRPPLRC